VEIFAKVGTSDSYTNPGGRRLSSFEAVQQEHCRGRVKALLTKVLCFPAWRTGKREFCFWKNVEEDQKTRRQKKHPELPKDDHIRECGEEFVCLAYLAFVSEILGRLRNVAMIYCRFFSWQNPTPAVFRLFTFDPRPSGVEPVLVPHVCNRPVFVM